MWGLVKEQNSINITSTIEGHGGFLIKDASFGQCPSFCIKKYRRTHAMRRTILQQAVAEVLQLMCF